MTDHPISIRIISRQEQLRDSLQVLLTSLTKIETVEVTRDVSAQPDKNKTTQPALVLLALDSSDSDADTLHTLNKIKSTWLNARIVVLVENEVQYRAAQMAEVDFISFHGIAAAQLLEQIDDLLPKVDP